MPAPLSIIVPTLDAAPSLARLVPQLMEGLAKGLLREVIVTDGGSSDDTAGLSEKVGAVFVSGPAGRGGQLRRGVAASRGAWLLVLHADSDLPDGWGDVVRDAMVDPTRAYAFRLGFRTRGLAPRWVAGWANFRSRWFRLPYGDQGLLISRDLYDASGGYPDIPLMEDVALARALGGRMALLPAKLKTSAASYEADGWIRRGARNLWTLARYLAGADPEALARSYRR